eukprot:457930-Prymnesium_polylepis.2
MRFAFGRPSRLICTFIIVSLCHVSADTGRTSELNHDVAFHYPRWTIALRGVISNAYNAFKCTQTHHTTA